MINKITSSPAFKSEVRVIYGTQECLRKGEANPRKRASYFQLKDKFYDSDVFARELDKIRNDNRENIVTFFPSRDEYGHPYMQMHVLKDDPDNGKSYAMARIYSPREISDRYENIDQRGTKIEAPTKVFRAIA